MEIILPGAESVHGGRYLHHLLDDGEPWHDSFLLPPGDRLLKEAGLIDAVKEELGLDQLQTVVDPDSGDYEFLAPDGYEFVMRQRFTVGSEKSNDWPAPSDQLREDMEAETAFVDDLPDPVGSEFRGPRLSLTLNHDPVNPTFSRSNEWCWHSLRRRSDGDRPEVRIIVKSEHDVSMRHYKDMTLPFDVEGRPRPTWIMLPDTKMTFDCQKSEGLHGEVTLDLEPTAKTPDEPPYLQSVMVYGLLGEEEMWLPHEITREASFAEYEADDPRTIGFMIERLGSKQAVYDYFRRNWGTPFSDDPVWRSKDLRLPGIDMDGLDEYLSHTLSDLTEGPIKEIGVRLLKMLGSQEAVKKMREFEEKEEDPEPF